MFLPHYAMTSLGRIMQHREWAVLAVLTAHLLFFAVDLLAARLRAPGPFRSLRRRLVGVAVVGAYLLMWNRWISPEFPHVFRSITVPQFPDEQQRLVSLLSLLIPGTLLLVSWQAILERPVHEVRMVRAWIKWGWKGRILGRVFYPGWPSGVVFAFLLACSFAALLGWRDFEIWQRYQVKAGISVYNWSDILPYDWHDLLRRSPSHWAAFTGLLIVPLVLWQWLLPNLLRWNLFGYLLIFAGTAMLQKSILALAVFMGDKGIAKWALPFPGMYWYWPAYQRPGWREFWTVIVPGVDWSSGTILILSGVVCLAWWMAALGFAARAFRFVRAVERKAEAALTAGPPVPDGSGGMGPEVAVFAGKKRPRIQGCGPAAELPLKPQPMESQQFRCDYLCNVSFAPKTSMTPAAGRPKAPQVIRKRAAWWWAKSPRPPAGPAMEEKDQAMLPAAPHFPGGDAGHVGALHGLGDHFTNREQGHGQNEHGQPVADGVEREANAKDGITGGDDTFGSNPPKRCDANHEPEG